jgi:enamine deaminase RidA (YjgF/YER057c/UK114 family)
LPRAVGYSHGVVADGRLLFVAGQIGVAAGGRLDPSFAAQFNRAVANVVAVVEEAGGRAADLVELRIFVTDLAAYRAARPDLRTTWKGYFGDNDPAVTLVEVKGLLDEGALVEIAGQAVLPGPPPSEKDA